MVICLSLEFLQRLKQILNKTSNDVSVVCLHDVHKLSCQNALLVSFYNVFKLGCHDLQLVGFIYFSYHSLYNSSMRKSNTKFLKYDLKEKQEK